jgi:phosphoglycolate phosphatase
MPRFAHLIFDLDGTLVDTQADLAAATNYMLEVCGLPQLSLAQVRGYIGHGPRVLVERALDTTDDRLVSRGFDLFMRYYTGHLLDHTRVYAGMENVLAAARAQGIVLSVLTNKPEVPSRSILSGLGLASLFSAVVGGDTFPAKKPDPQGVTYLQQVSRVDSAQTLLVGDSSIDIETGRTAGIATCWVTWGYGTQHSFSVLPRFIVDSPDQLLPLVLA